MRLDKLTIKLQQAIQDSVNLSREKNHQQVEPEHIIYSLLRQEDSLLLKILDKLGAESFSLIKAIEEELDHIPRISGRNIQVYFSGRTNQLLMQAGKEAQALKDEFISGEHVFLAFIQDPDSLVYRQLKKMNIAVK